MTSLRNRLRRAYTALVIACCVAPCIASTPSFAQTPPASSRPRPDDDKLRDSLIVLETKSWEAWKRRDGSYFQTFLSDDHAELGTGGVSTKAQVVAFVGNKTCVVSDYKIDSFTFTRFSADVALLTYRAAQTTKCGTAMVASPAWTSSLFIHRDGRWQNAVYQQTPIPKPPG
jgi:hypothetical protein